MSGFELETSIVRLGKHCQLWLQSSILSFDLGIPGLFFFIFND